jgi:hypothetical protein
LLSSYVYTQHTSIRFIPRDPFLFLHPFLLIPHPQTVPYIHSPPIIFIITITTTTIDTIIVSLSSIKEQEHVLFGPLSLAYFTPWWTPVLSIFLQMT